MDHPALRFDFVVLRSRADRQLIAVGFIGERNATLFENEIAAFSKVANTLLETIFKPKCVGDIVLLAVGDGWALRIVCSQAFSYAVVVSITIGTGGLGIWNIGEGIVRLFELAPPINTSRVEYRL